MADITTNNIVTANNDDFSYTPSTVTDACLVLCVSNETNTTHISAPTFGGVAMTLGASDIQTGGYDTEAFIYYLVNPGTSAGTISVTGENRDAYTVLTLDNVDQTTPIDATGTAATTGNTAAVASVTTATDGAMIIAQGTGSSNAGTATADGTQTEIADFLDTSSIHVTSEELRATAGAVNQGFTYTNSQDRQVTVGVAFKNSGGIPTTDVSITGVSATGSVGSVSVQADITTSLTGVTATGAVGSLVVQMDADAPVVGVQGTGAAGEVTTSTASIITAPITGVSATGQVGTLNTQVDASFPLTGVVANGAIGALTVSISGSATALVTGVSATGQIGTLFIPQDANAALTGVTATGQIGTLIASIAGNWTTQPENTTSWSTTAEDGTTWSEQAEDTGTWTKQ